MPANLRIWGAEPPKGSGRAATRARRDDVEWHAVTTLADGSEEWKSSDPAKEANKEEVAQRMFVKKWLRSDPDARFWRDVVESGRAKTLEKERQLEKEQARINEREAHNGEEIAVRRLMRTTVKRLGTAINQVVVGDRELVQDAMRPAAGWKKQRRKKAEVMEEAKMRSRMVTTRELRAAFAEFKVDARKDKGLKEPHEYRQWLWTDRNTVYLAPAGRRKRGGQGRVAG
jgi:hypothetical protein